MFVDFLEQGGFLFVVTRFYRLEYFGVKVDVVRGANQGLDVFREAGAAVAHAGVDKLVADARVAADALPHGFDIRTQQFGQVGNFVDKADFGG